MGCWKFQRFVCSSFYGIWKFYRVGSFKKNTPLARMLAKPLLKTQPCNGSMRIKDVPGFVENIFNRLLGLLIGNRTRLQVFL